MDYAAAELFDRLRATTGADGRAQAETTLAGTDALTEAVEQYSRTFDRRHGGFGDAPKFPRPSELLLLLREHARTGSARGADRWRPRPCGRWRSAACATTSVAASIATRSTREWRVPHFEKMLYDQAQLVLAYLEAGQAAGDPFYFAVAEDTLAYVRARSSRPAAAASIRPKTPTASCPAADHKREGAFYVWSRRGDRLAPG